MPSSTVLPVNHSETAQSAAHGILGNALVHVCPTCPGFGLLARILDYPYPPFGGYVTNTISPKYISGALKAPPRSPDTPCKLKIITADLATFLSPAVSLTP